MSRFRTNYRRYAALTLTALLVVGVTASQALAAGIFTARKVTLTNENPSATTVGYNFTLTAQNSTTVKRVEFQFGSTLGGSSLPSGMSTASAALNGAPTNLGGAGTWTIDNTSSGTGLIKINNSSNTGSPSANATVNFSGITNPSSAQTYYVRVSSYDTASSGGTLIDQSDIAFPIANSSVTVTAVVAETLSFSLSATSLTLSPNPMATGSVATGSHTMSIATNASAGWNISALSSSTTLTKGTDTIPFITNGGTVTAGTPNYGVAWSGASGHPSGDNNPSTIGTVASSASPTSGATTTATYKGAISATTPAGTYTSTVSYVATANF